MNNEMPDEIYAQYFGFNSDEYIMAKYNGEKPKDGGTKYVRADKAAPVGDVELFKQEIIKKYQLSNREQDGMIAAIDYLVSAGYLHAEEQKGQSNE